MEKNICRNCMHYSAYYRQRESGYENLSFGICSVCKEQRKRGETCEKFKTDELREKRRKQSLYFALERAARSISDMVDIIKEKESTE